MSARRRPTPKPLKNCLWCKQPIASTRAPVLLTTVALQIVGPFHAGCAERLRIQAERNPTHNWLEGAAAYGNILPAREETLPE